MATKTKEKAVRRSNLEDIAVPPEQEARTLRERAMLVSAPMGCWSGQGRDNKTTGKMREEAKAEGRIGVFIKEKLDASYLSPVNRVIQTARAYHKAVTLPWGDDQRRLLAAMIFFAYKKQMTAYEREFWVEVDKFLDQLYDERGSLRPELVKVERKRLGGLFDINDYPTRDEMRRRFKFRVYVDPIPTSDDFRVSLSGEETEEIKREYDTEVRSRMREGVVSIYDAASNAVGELREKLADPDAEIRSSSFAALKRLVASLPQLNSVLQDPTITEMGKKLADDLLAVPTDDVAHDMKVRSATKMKADAILKVLEPLRAKA